MLDRLDAGRAHITRELVVLEADEDAALDLDDLLAGMRLENDREFAQ